MDYTLRALGILVTATYKPVFACRPCQGDGFVVVTSVPRLYSRSCLTNGDGRLSGELLEQLLVVKTTLGKTIFIFSSPLLKTACAHTAGNTGLQAVQSPILILAGENCTASRFDMLSAVAIKSSHAPEKASLRLEQNARLGGPDVLDACRASSNRCRESSALLREPTYAARYIRKSRM